MAVRLPRTFLFADIYEENTSIRGFVAWEAMRYVDLEHFDISIVMGATDAKVSRNFVAPVTRA
jgi:hypothetical protein